MISRNQCSAGFTSGNIVDMIRGDLGFVSLLLLCACSSRAVGSAPSDAGLTNTEGAEATDVTLGDASSSEPVSQSTERETSTQVVDRDPPFDSSVTHSHAATDGGSVQVTSSDDQTVTPVDAGAGAGLFEVNAHLANEDSPEAPTTVGIVTWSLAVGPITEATVEFGPTTDYGMVAPVDLSDPKSRAVLLGMKPERTYHYRIRASVDGRTLLSDDFTIDTGAAPIVDVVSIASYDVLAPSVHESGFIVASYWNGTYQGMVFILDPDGEIVWWYRSGLKGGVAKAAFSADGRDIWMISASNNGGEKLVRVGIDGLRPQTYPDTGGSHDIVAVDGDVMAFIDYSSYNTVVEIDRSGERREVFQSMTFPERGPSPHHLNALAYDEATDNYVVSSHNTDVYVFPRAGSTPQNTLLLSSVVGSSMDWGGFQHGVQLLPDNHVLVFANKGGGTGTLGPSAVIDYDLDSGEETWRYAGDEFTANFGDVQRLPGGNTLVTYSNTGVVLEVTPEHETALVITAEDYLGYVTWRQSLYPAAK